MKLFSGSVEFFDELFDFLPNLMEKSLGLIREACSLSLIDILLRILKVAGPVESHELDHILDSFWRIERVENDPIRYCCAKDKLCYILLVAAQHGHLHIIRFLWPVMEATAKHMTIGTGANAHRSVIEFLLWESGGCYMKVAQTM